MSNKNRRLKNKNVVCECGFVSRGAISECPSCGANLKEKKHGCNGHPVPRKAVIGKRIRR